MLRHHPTGAVGALVRLPMKQPSLLLCSQAGSPEDPKTWSGTPNRLLSAMRDDGRFGVLPLSSRLQGGLDRVAALADRTVGLNHAFIWGAARRRIASGRVRQQALSSGCSAILHLGTYDVPWTPSAVPSYLYVDNTYDLWEHQARIARQLRPHQRRWFRRLEHRSLSRVRHVFTVGQHVACNFTEAFGVPRERVSAVGSGLGGIQAFDGAKDYRKHRLLMVAKVRPADKGLPLTVEAMRLLRKRLPDAELVVVGGADYPELRGCEGIRGTGWITLRELQELYEQSTLFVMPATYEPWGLSYLEALVCRTPVVGLARNALPEITDCGRYGFMLESATPEALAALLEDAFADTDRLERMGADGQRSCLSRYRWESVATRIVDKISIELVREGKRA